MLIFIPFYWFDQKQLFKPIQIFLRICPFWNMVRKTKFLSISVLVSAIITFMSKNISSLWISPKMLQNNSKAYVSSMWLTLRRKIFLLIFIPFTGLIKNSCLNKSKFSSSLPLLSMVRKTNFLSISVFFSEIVTFMSEKKSSLWISPKMLQNNRKAWFSSISHTLWRKTVFVNIYPLVLVWTKKIV